MELLDDSAEASACQVQELETILLGLSLIGGVTLMRGVVPDFPVGETISDVILELSTWTGSSTIERSTSIGTDESCSRGHCQ